MRKLLVTYLIALLAGAVSAQTAPRSSGSTPRTSLTPSTSQRGNNTPSTQSGSRSSGQVSGAKTTKTQAATSRTDASPGASYNPTQSRSTQTQGQQTTSRTSVARPSSNVPQQNTGANATTARTVNTPAKKAPEIKAPVNPVRVKWMSLEEALEKSKTEKRKIFVDVYTDWCGWCKRMDSTTFINPVVAQYLNDHYYPVKFNAEQQSAITYKDKVYQFKKSGARGYHELAALWLNNRLSYPTTVFLDESQGVIQPLPGYQDAAKMEAILNYFGTDSHKKTPWESYQKNFNNGGGGQK